MSEPVLAGRTREIGEDVGGGEEVAGAGGVDDVDVRSGRVDPRALRPLERPSVAEGDDEDNLYVRAGDIIVVP